ncbi:modification methylase-like protein [Leptomonas seymouri]|uniref:DNA (cytosine-5-)-methyltransferase n=1 Tax=Leptomonas seymouri TaxID=5684 RepID=A0A0N1IHE0_LEPSE|nr:modification methylase-like protein [Leptomonas seymouri]|eukprot:KPI83711.1 modification methylase-like protein [Leptomonas seymouri]
MAAHDVAAPYPSSYPAGVLLVSSPQHLGPLVLQLRAMRKLKTGRNVTVFNAEHFAEAVCSVQCAEAVGACACGATAQPKTHAIASDDAEVSNGGGCLQGERTGGLLTSRVRLYEMTADEAAAYHVEAKSLPSLGGTHEVFSLVTLSDSEAGQQLLALLQIPRARRTDSASAGWPPYMAVHVNGEIPDAELFSYLKPSASGAYEDGSASKQRLFSSPPPLGFLGNVRRFHRVCCPNLKELPSALAALRQSALMQRCLLRGEHRGSKAGDHASARATSTATDPCSVWQREAPNPQTFAAAASCADTGKPTFTFSELFGGIGMFRAALERVGGRATFAVEFAPPAQMVYALNHPCWHDCPPALQLPNAAEGRAALTQPLPPLLVGDITEIPTVFFPPHDVLTGGFPCQSFAKAGTAAGLHAEKGWLFYEVVRVLAATKPTAFLLENVDHLTEVEAGAQLAEILCRLRYPASTAALPKTPDSSHDSGNRGVEAPTCTKEGDVEYEVRHVVVDGAALTPQTRRRVYFFGFRVAQPAKSVEAPAFVFPRAGEEAAAAASEVVADALRRVQNAAKASLYTCVQDLLVVPSVKDLPLRQQSTSSYDESDALLASSMHLNDKLQLTPTQWEAVRRSHTFRQNRMWRVCDLNGKARTLLGSYRTSYQLYSEFVPCSPTLTLSEVKDALMQADARTEYASTDEGLGMSVPSLPPLRFFSIRECARLQGIDDAFRLPHDECCHASQSQGEENGISPAVLRQVPSGAVYKLVGNAVNPRVVECLGGAIAVYLLSRRTPQAGLLAD